MRCSVCHIDVDPTATRCPRCLRRTTLVDPAAVVASPADAMAERPAPSPWLVVALALGTYAWFACIVLFVVQERWLRAHGDDALAQAGLVALLLGIVRVTRAVTGSWLTTLGVTLSNLAGVISIVGVTVWIAVGALRLSLTPGELASITVLDTVIIAAAAGALGRLWQRGDVPTADD
ncbi:MAG: hypothetical protein WCJ30_09630 [Deltaproteobacteria bacterium]